MVLPRRIQLFATVNERRTGSFRHRLPRMTWPVAVCHRGIPGQQLGDAPIDLSDVPRSSARPLPEIIFRSALMPALEEKSIVLLQSQQCDCLSIVLVYQS